MSNYLDLLQYGQRATEDYAAIIEKQLAKAWLEAYKQVDADLAIFMARFGDFEEAQKYNRLVGLKSSIAEQFKSLTGKAIDGTADISANSYTTAFQSTWYSLEQTTRLGLDFGVIPVDAIRASVYSQISGADFATRFGKLYTSTVDKVAESITRAMATGQGYAKTAREIKSLWEGSFFNAIRVIRTESTRNFTEGSILAYEKAEQQGIKGTKTWLATRDLRTRPDHARLNGKEADKNGYFHIPPDKGFGPGMFSQPENSINCRCSTYYKLKGFEKDYTPDWTYSQWEREFGDWQKLPPRQRKAI